jgi:HAD superfamily hydrolase (TIGR01549 family)
MIKNILWDFDGVILDSMEVRDYGFKAILKDFKEADVKRLIEYHRINGGLSRYVKIRYFFHEILKLNVTEQEVNSYASKFSEIMRVALVNPKNLIQDSVNFIKDNYTNYNFHIVSGSDQQELRFLCKQLGIENYFLSIGGSPIPKNELVKHLLESYNYVLSETCLLGDSINDYEAAKTNNIIFYGYNNPALKESDKHYIEELKNYNFS